MFLAALGLGCGACGSVGTSSAMVCGLSCLEECGILATQSGSEPTSPALEGGFLTTGPPGKSLEATSFIERKA